MRLGLNARNLTVKFDGEAHPMFKNGIDVAYMTSTKTFRLIPAENGIKGFLVKGGRVYQLQRTFKGITPFKPVEVSPVYFDDMVEICLEGQELKTFTKRGMARTPSKPPAIGLKEALMAVNYHKDQHKGDLVLSIDERGHVRALLEY